jgi:DnaK suppressor protein
MNVRQLEARLREKERELWADMSRTEAEARGSGIPEPQDTTAMAEAKESLFRETTSDWSIYYQVRDALQRIEKGTYGRCVDCGSKIEDHRLESMPWTPYCLHHQKQHDRGIAAR